MILYWFHSAGRAFSADVLHVWMCENFPLCVYDIEYLIPFVECAVPFFACVETFECVIE